MKYPMFVCGLVKKGVIVDKCEEVNAHSLDDIHCMKEQKHLGLQEIASREYLITSKQCPLYKEVINGR